MTLDVIAEPPLTKLSGSAHEVKIEVKKNPKSMSQIGDRSSRHPLLENHTWLKVSLEILVQSHHTHTHTHTHTPREAIGPSR